METYNINEAGKASGLNPSVLRVWELRYGWPKPQRKANGYRTYGAHQVEDLRRVSELVKCGTPIRQIIVDGLPCWPTQQVQHRVNRGLVDTWNLPRPADALAIRLQGELIQALERRRTNAVKELVHRAIWTMHIHDEMAASLTTVLFGCAELAEEGRALADQDALRQLVQERCLQRLRGFPRDPGTWVVPASTADHPLAALVALAFCLQGDPAQPWLGSGAPATGGMIRVGPQADPPDNGLECVLHFRDIRAFCAAGSAAHATSRRS